MNHYDTCSCWLTDMVVLNTDRNVCQVYLWHKSSVIFTSSDWLYGGRVVMCLRVTEDITHWFMYTAYHGAINYF